jgi:hypothetical protein
MTRKSRGGRITALKRLAVEGHGGREMVGNHPVGRNTMEIW